MYCREFGGDSDVTILRLIKILISCYGIRCMTSWSNVWGNKKGRGVLALDVATHCLPGCVLTILLTSAMWEPVCILVSNILCPDSNQSCDNCYCKIHCRVNTGFICRVENTSKITPCTLLEMLSAWLDCGASLWRRFHFAKPQYTGTVYLIW